MLCVITSPAPPDFWIPWPHGQAAIAYPQEGGTRHERHHRLDLNVSLPIPTREDKEIRDDRDDWLDLIGLSPAQPNGRKETRDDPHHRLDLIGLSPTRSNPGRSTRDDRTTGWG